MKNKYGCSTDGEFIAGSAEDAASCGSVCENLGLKGCCEWQHGWEKCMFQPNDDTVETTDASTSAAYCSSDHQGKKN